MKVYVVTKGDYSSYRILKVFLDKKKAEEYAKYSSSSWEKAVVETYDTNDENFQIKGGYIKCTLHFKVSMFKVFNLETLNEQWCVNTFFNEKDYKNQVEYVYLKKALDGLIFETEFLEADFHKDEENAITYEFSLTRYFKEFDNFVKNTPDKCKKLLTKIGSDICAEISNYMLEGLDKKQIDEIMCSRYLYVINKDDIEEEKD